MQRRAKNRLVILLVIAIAVITAITLMGFPAAGSATPPQWVWDEQGRVTDATGQYVRLTDEEACEMYDLCPEMAIGIALASVGSGSTGSDGAGPDGGGCR